MHYTLFVYSAACLAGATPVVQKLLVVVCDVVCSTKLDVYVELSEPGTNFRLSVSWCGAKLQILTVQRVQPGRGPCQTCAPEQLAAPNASLTSVSAMGKLLPFVKVWT